MGRWRDVPLEMQDALSAASLFLVAALVGVEVSIAVGGGAMLVALFHTWLIVWSRIKEIDPHKL